MTKIDARFIGTELYFSDLDRARDFYSRVLGLKMSEEQAGHHAKFISGPVSYAWNAKAQHYIRHRIKRSCSFPCQT